MAYPRSSPSLTLSSRSAILAKIEWDYYKARLSSVDSKFRSKLVVNLVKNDDDSTVIWKQPKGSTPIIDVGARAGESTKYRDRDQCRTVGLNADVSFSRGG